MIKVKPPECRPDRKKEEYKMAVIRTVFNMITGVIALITFPMTMLILWHQIIGGK